MRFFRNLARALSLALPFISPSLAHAHAHQGRRHHVHQADLARRDPGEINLYKRQFNNARFTYYAVGLGACGVTNVPSDFIVALNSDQYNGGQYCFQMITITANGKTTQAQIMDECPGCPVDGLDFSQDLFGYFSDISAGVIYGSWDFDSGGSSPSSSPAPAPAPSPSPSPTPTSVDVPTTTWVPPPTTTSQPPPTTTSAPPTTSSSSSTSTTVSSSTSSLVPTQTATTNPVAVSAGAVAGGTANSTLDDLNTAIVYIAELLSACRTV